MLFDQAVFAGQFLGGTYGSLQVHRDGANSASIVVLVAVIAAILLRWPGRGPVWPMFASIALFVLIGVQIFLGYVRILTLHVPLGVAIIMIAAALAVWAWATGRRER
jgi:heme A synthase